LTVSRQPESQPDSSPITRHPSLITLLPDAVDVPTPSTMLDSRHLEVSEGASICA
jgi:hypothetical protein